MTSYSVRNSLDMPTSRPTSPAMGTPSISTISALSTLKRKGTTPLSKILFNPSLATDGTEKSFAAFKVLPIDPARIRRASSTGGALSDTSDELTEASNCQEAVDLIVESIRKACQDIGGAHGDFVRTEDVVR